MTMTLMRRLFPLACLAVVGWAGGCSQERQAKPTTRPATVRDRQDRAMRDPFNYRPDWHESGVSGGGTADLDKDGLKRDLDDVLLR